MCIDAIKTCFRCGRDLPITEFYKHPRMRDGHLGKCKKCTRADVSANYARRRRQYSEYEAKRYREPGRRAKVKKYASEYRLRNPGKAKARSKFNYHFRKGNIEREPCEICGDENSQAHHEDYAIENALNVKWLCFTHHREAHGQTVVTDNPEYERSGGDLEPVGRSQSLDRESDGVNTEM